MYLNNTMCGSCSICRCAEKNKSVIQIQPSGHNCISKPLSEIWIIENKVQNKSSIQRQHSHSNRKSPASIRLWKLIGAPI